MNIIAFINFITTFLAAFQINLTEPQVQMLTMAIKGFFSSSFENDMKEIESMLDPNKKIFNTSIFALIFAKMGAQPDQIKSLMNTIANSIAAQGELYFTGKKESNEFFQVVVKGLSMFLGPDHEMVCKVGGTINSFKKSTALQIVNAYVPEEGKGKKEQKEGGYSEACKSLTMQWLKGEIPEQSKSILNFLPAEVPATEELALPIMKKALTDRATATATKKESRKRL